MINQYNNHLKKLRWSKNKCLCGSSKNIRIFNKDRYGIKNPVKALENVFNHYSYLSPHYQYSSSLGNKATQEIALVSIPSIFYGSKIKKGTVKLDFYVSGSLIGRLIDSGSNGELVQVSGTIASNDGKVAGGILYNEGFVVLTGSWNIDTGLTYAHSRRDVDSAINHIV